VEIKTETDSTDITECSRNNKPITGMYVVSDAYSVQSFDSVSHIYCLHYSILLLTAVQHVM